LGDGARGVEDRNKRQIIKKLSTQFFFSKSAVVLWLVAIGTCLSRVVSVCLMMG